MMYLLTKHNYFYNFLLIYTCIYSFFKLLEKFKAKYTDLRDLYTRNIFLNDLVYLCQYRDLKDYSLSI